MLEQLAEECTELAQAALKKARYIRKNNPVYKPVWEIDDNLAEEVADVLICINELYESNIVNIVNVAKHNDEKLKRMKERVEEMGEYPSCTPIK